MKKVLFSLLFALAAQAGQEGHGGGSVVCRNPATQEIISAQLLDIWEGQLAKPMGLGLDISEVDHRAPDLIAREKIANLLANNPLFGTKVLAEYEKLLRITYILPSGITIADPLDTGNLFIQQGCAVEYAANYKEDPSDSDILFLNKDIVERLNPTNHAALLVHEAIYKVLRENTPQNSIRTRKLVGNLFSSVNIPIAIPVPKNAKKYWCRPTVSSFIWSGNMYETDDAFTFDFETMEGNIVSTQKRLSVLKKDLRNNDASVDSIYYECSPGYPADYSKCNVNKTSSYLEGGEEILINSAHEIDDSYLFHISFLNEKNPYAARPLSNIGPGSGFFCELILIKEEK